MTGFRLSEDQQAKASEFIAERRKENTSAIGGQFTYQFTPTTLGLGISIKDNISGEVCDLSDYEGW